MLGGPAGGAQVRGKNQTFRRTEWQSVVNP